MGAAPHGPGDVGSALGGQGETCLLCDFGQGPRLSVSPLLYLSSEGDVLD